MRQRRRQSLKEVLKSVLRVEQELHFTLPYVFAESALPAANSASCYGCFEDVLVEPVVIAELELSHVQRQILTAHFMERTHHATFQDGPEAFNGVRVDGTDHIVALGVVDGFVREVFPQVLVAYPLIRNQQADSIRDGFTYEGFQGRRLRGSRHGSHL